MAYGWLVAGYLGVDGKEGARGKFRGSMARVKKRKKIFLDTRVTYA